MCYFHPPPSELPRLFWQLSLVHPFGARRISLVNPLLRISAGESHLMVGFAPMGGARRRSMSILHVKPIRPAYVPICISFCQVRLERGIRPCSCWRYKCHWQAIDKWGDASKPALNLLCERSMFPTTSMASCATLTTSTLLTASSALPRVEYALGHSCKRLLPHVLDLGDLKLRVGGNGVFCERHRRHLLLDSHLIGCQLVDCCGCFRWDCRSSSVPVPKSACSCVRSCLRHHGCIVGRDRVIIIVLIRQHVEHIGASLCISLLSCHCTKGQGLEAPGVCLMDECF